MKTVIFNLADKEYGINIDLVSEVIRIRKITPVPKAADFVEGVITLRGKVVPIVNLRKKLGIETPDASVLKRIIVTQLNNHFMGVLVDDVSGVIAIEGGDISPPDEVLKKAKYLKGIAKINKRLILIIDFLELLSKEDKSVISAVHGKVEVKSK